MIMPKWWQSLFQKNSLLTKTYGTEQKKRKERIITWMCAEKSPFFLKRLFVCGKIKSKGTLNKLDQTNWKWILVFHPRTHTHTSIHKKLMGKVCSVLELFSLFQKVSVIRKNIKWIRTQRKKLKNNNNNNKRLKIVWIHSHSFNYPNNDQTIFLWFHSTDLSLP